MSTKPNIALARFADTGSAVRTAPTSGERDTGLIGGALIDEGVLNELWFRHYEWDKWLDDGDCAFHDLSATGTLQATGATTLSGGLTVPTGQAVALNGNTTLTVGTGAVTFGGLVTANAGIAVPTGQAVTVSGTLAMSGTALQSGPRRVSGTAVSVSTGNNNDFSLPAHSFVTLNGSGSPVLTGAIPAGAGHIITFVVASASPSIQFTHEDTNSTLGNRFHLPGAATLTVATGQMVTFIYAVDGVARWLLMSKNF